MFSLSVNLTSNEWLKIQQFAAKQFPNERLSRSEIIRRYVLAGIEALGNRSPDELARLVHGFQASQAAPEERLRK